MCGLKPINKLVEKLKKAEEEIQQALEAGTPVETEDPLVKAFGSDGHGRVRGCGPISRTAYDLSAHARAKVDELKSKDGELRAEVKELGGKMEFMIEGFATLCNVIKEIQTGQSSYIGSNHQDSSSGSPAAINSASNPLVANAEHANFSPTPRNAAAEIAQGNGLEDLSPARSAVSGSGAKAVGGSGATDQRVH